MAADSSNNLNRAKAAFDTALRLNPGLALAHHLLTPLEVDIGLARDAMVRLVTLARDRPGDAELFAGLVHACRYCGLLDASIAADARALAIDPKMHTSAVQTRFQLGDYAHVALLDAREYPVVVGCALIALGRNQEARARLRPLESTDHRLRDFAAAIRAVAEDDGQAALAVIDRILNTGFRAPEELYHLARLLARLGVVDQAVAALRRAISGGYYPSSAIARDPWLDPLRVHDEWSDALDDAARLHQDAAAAFMSAGGHSLLGTGS